MIQKYLSGCDNKIAFKNPVSRGHPNETVWEESQQGPVCESFHFHIKTEQEEPYVHIGNSGQAVLS